MRLPKDILSPQTYTKPNIYLCETDKTKICRLETTDTQASLKFNAYSELSFVVGRTYDDMISGTQKVNPFYDKIEALRLIYVEGFGYFEIQDPEIESDGIREVKNITAYSLEYNLSQKYLEGLYINMGTIGSIEVTYADYIQQLKTIYNSETIDANSEVWSILLNLGYRYDNTKSLEDNVKVIGQVITQFDALATNGIVPVTLYNQQIPQLSLLHLIFEKVYGWTIKHVDNSLQKMSRSFDISRTSVYDFIMQDISDKFNCFVVFDTIDNTISVYAESLISKFFGDGSKKEFTISPPYGSIGTVTIDGYNTIEYTYEIKEIDKTQTGVLTLEKAPIDGATIEVVDGSQSKWTTDVYVAFENLVQEVNVSYSADDIKTVLTVKGADDLNIREVNMGLPYITDLSYYYSVDWMGQDLYNAYKEYLKRYNSQQDEYESNAKDMLEILDKITYETNRMSLQYSQASAVTSTTVGKYYVRGGEEGNYYYTEVNLPGDYKANVQYYTLLGNDLTAEKFSELYKAIQTYYNSEDTKDISEIEKLAESFAFMTEYSIENLKTDLSQATQLTEKDSAVRKFIDKLWPQLGLNPLKELYQKPYKAVSDANIESEWNKTDSDSYWLYYPVTLVLASLDEAIKQREDTIEGYRKDYNSFNNKNIAITNSLLMDVFFVTYCKEQGLDDAASKKKAQQMLVRLSSFLREDEYTDDNFVVTDADTIDSSMQTMRQLLEGGRIELSKLCAPKLEFSMSMANIYALPEFAPIIDQFQLGNLINVAIRSDYIKRARLLEVTINFEDFSDFSCEFGELTSLRTSSSIHADLLASAMQAGKSVASNASYWNQGADLATSTDLKIQQGFISAVGGLYTADQSIVIDDNGILLRKVNEDGSFSPNQTYLKNNTFLMSTNGFANGANKNAEGVQLGLGEFEIDGETVYGILAKYMLSGYIESSTIVGGTINIGNGRFKVDSDGSVTMHASAIEGYVGIDNIISSINQSPEEIAINANKISLAGKNINLTSDNVAISSTNFSVTKDGKITATSGEIGGWTIGANSIEGSKDKYKALISKSAIGTSDNVVFGVYDGSAWSCYMDGVGKLFASNAVITGNITATSGSIAGYNIGSGGSYDNAIYKRVTGSSAKYEVGLKATSGSTDLAFYVKKSTDNWSNSSNVFYVDNSGKLYAENAVITGEINATSGNIGGCSISNGVLNVDAAYISSGTINSARIPNLSADKITAGTIHVDRIPSLNADKITVGTLNAARIPNINADKITAGVLDVGRIPNISADKITSGTISTNRLSSSVITTGNFSSKTLTTGNLSVTNGGNIGIWTVNSNNYLYAISGNYGVSLSALSVSHGQGGVATWVNIVKAGQNASDERLKTNITEFDDKLDTIFDNLKPVQFEYSKEFLGTGVRFGYTAQDVIESFENEGMDVSNYSFIYETEIEDGSEDKYYQVNKADFIALNTWQIQKLKARVEELENKLAALET